MIIVIKKEKFSFIIFIKGLKGNHRSFFAILSVFINLIYLNIKLLKGIIYKKYINDTFN